ncbi:uncharacterized protein BDZ99DRAFT_414435, partial [Mytilinidion resinicola]
MAHPLNPTTSAAPSNPPPPSSSSEPTSTSTSASKKRKRSSQNPKESHLLHASTLRNPLWTYLHLAFLPAGPPPASSAPPTPNNQPEDLDPLTARTHLTAPLAQFLGTHGASVSIEILKIEGREVWIRVPREDGKVVGAGLAGWVGKAGAWRVVGRGEWLGRLIGDRE